MPFSSPDADLRPRLRVLLQRVTDLAAGKSGIDLLADLGPGDEVDHLALAIHVLHAASPASEAIEPLRWLDTCPWPAVALSGDGQVVRCNVPFCELISLPPDLVAGQPLRRILRGSDLWLERIERICRHPPGPVMELQRLDGSSARAWICAWRADDLLLVVAIPEATLPQAAQPPAPQAATVTAGPLVLVVDDDPVVRHVTAELLEACGYRAQQLQGPRDALKWFADDERAKVAALLVDVSMPGMTGTELVAQLGPKLRGIPVIYMTGYADAEAAPGEEARVLRKPFALGDLARTLREVAAGTPSV